MQKIEVKKPSTVITFTIKAGANEVSCVVIRQEANLIFPGIGDEKRKFLIPPSTMYNRLEKWKNGGLIQDVFPDPFEAEWFLTGRSSTSFHFEDCNETN